MYVCMYVCMSGRKVCLERCICIILRLAIFFVVQNISDATGYLCKRFSWWGHLSSHLISSLSSFRGLSQSHFFLSGSDRSRPFPRCLSVSPFVFPHSLPLFTLQHISFVYNEVFSSFPYFSNHLFFFLSFSVKLKYQLI